jgi:hypothetical protein
MAKSAKAIKKEVMKKSNKVMGKVKVGLEDVGETVTKKATKTVPFFQRTAKKLLGMLGLGRKTRRSRK